MRHIGIVGCSAEGAALCYRTICAEGAELLGGHAHPEITMHTQSLDRYVACLERDDRAGVAALMLDSTRKLAAAGAEFVVCPDNTIHDAFATVIERSPLPWLHIAEVVADEATRRGCRRVGILGTSWLVRSEVYPTSLSARGIEAVRPADSDRNEVSRIIMDELVHGHVLATSVDVILTVIGRLAAEGCDAVVLGCTELPLVVSDANSPLPVLDSTRLLARAALAHATADVLRDTSG